ncbi:hypothetical protein PHSY_003848 [Pseudozyma hubeiensis SY62]|uniref:Uncharacterized protein n=1 Tax=Pseudozyma hubeiensis (strain SY62) TaxID=1305764 RepID=R9P4B2_PSEHS|nr:hypothetical protein PHSY_003848 [Pseudozyma hubeiensis SY62]GAC96268.1 hypothetical protein PHSY_003848 [Pseudozyma hubeiensis SY62]
MKAALFQKGSDGIRASLRLLHDAVLPSCRCPDRHLAATLFFLPIRISVVDVEKPLVHMVNDLRRLPSEHTMEKVLAGRIIGFHVAGRNMKRRPWFHPRDRMQAAGACRSTSEQQDFEGNLRYINCGLDDYSQYPFYRTLCCLDQTVRRSSERIKDCFATTTLRNAPFRNALDIPTPNSSRKIAGAGTAKPEALVSTPSKPAQGSFEPHRSSTQCADALYTPTRNAAASRVLSSSDHDAFQSLTSPLTSWPTSLVSPAPTGSSAFESSVDWSQDHQWWVAGASSCRGDDVFPSGTGSELLSPSSSSVPSETTHQRNTEQESFRERKGQSRRRQHATDYAAFALQLPPASMTPSSSSASSMPFTLTLPSTGMHNAPQVIGLEHGTPSLSTHLLPSNDLTEYLHTANRPRDTGLLGPNPSRMFGQAACTSSRRSLAEAEDVPVLSQVTKSAASDKKGAFVKWLSAHMDDVNDRRLFDLGEYGLRSSVGKNALLADHRTPLGLGLDIVASTASEQVEMLTSPALDASRTSVLRDHGNDGGREWEHQTSALFTNSRATQGDGRAIQEASMSSLSTAMETSFASHSNPSTWDSSFGQAPSSWGGDDSVVAEAHLADTSASSIGLNTSQNAYAEKPSVEGRPSSEMSALATTPEVFMQDLSEFSQSVPIQDMAEERWRTWPRHREGRSVVLPADVSDIGVASLNSTTGETGSFFDALSASVYPTRSRLGAEPYNKNLRSGRPSSSASTSTRSSIGGSIILEDESSNLASGPIRPRSFVGAGSLRMSAATRTNPCVGSDKLSSPKERVSGTAMALRHVRRLSQGSPASSGAARPSAMRSTRSVDSVSATDPRARYSIAMPNTLGNSYGAMTTSQRPQSMIDFSASYRDLPRQPRTGNGIKTSSRVGFSEVSEALNTLRLFLKQKKPINSNNAAEQDRDRPRTPNEHSREPSSPGKQVRTLRRSKRVLPPRGAMSSVDEVDALQPTTFSKSRQGLLSHQDVEDEASQSTHAMSSLSSTQSKQDDRLAVLEDLSERVMRLKAESELEKERHAAASMPPPVVRPASTVHQPIPSSPTKTRREMHDEYLRKRASKS